MSTGLRLRRPHRWVDGGIRVKGLVVVALPLFALATTVGTYAVLSQQQRIARQAVSHTIAVQAQVGIVLIDVLNAEAGVRGYLLTNNSQFLAPYYTARVATPAAIGRLEALLATSPIEDAMAQRVQSLVSARLNGLDSVLQSASVHLDTPTTLQRLLSTSRVVMGDIQAQLSKISIGQAQLLSTREARAHQATQELNAAMIVAGLFGFGGGLVAAMLFSSGVVRRVRTVEQNARNLYDRRPLLDVRGNDEIGRLAATLAQVGTLLSQREGELRRSQIFLRTIIDNIPLTIFVKDLSKSRFILINKAVVDLVGLSQDELLNKNVFELFPPEQAQFFTQMDHQTMIGGVLVDIPEEAVTTVHHGTRILHTRKVPIRGDEVSPPLLLGISEDITDAIETREELRRAKQEAERANQAKSEFLSAMSHEIRTPLNGMIGMTGLLLETSLTREQQDYAETARLSGESLLVIINDILNFSKIEAGRIELESIDFDLRAAIEETVDLAAVTAHSKGLELSTVIGSGLPQGVRGDPGRFRQILLNLLGNAIKFTELGEVIVKVSPLVSSDDLLHVRIEVTDTGIGITPSQRERLFESFTQADASTTRHYGGTGLGLAIAKGLAELLGGEIGCLSEPGQGSTFWFTVVVATAQLAMEVSYAAKEELAGLHVLIVDDNTTNQDILADTLRTWGMFPACVGSGPEALEALHGAGRDNNAFDVAMLDYHMPDMDGLCLARAIRAAGDLSVRLVLMTSSGMRGDAAAAKDAGIEVFLAKPVRQSSLFDCLATLMNASTNEVHAPLITQHNATRTRNLRAHLLVVDDNTVNQKVAATILENLGYRVDVARDGTEALNAISHMSYGAVLMDCQMPKMDGFQATLQIRRSGGLGAQTPIIAMTAGVGEEDKTRCLDAGMNDYISKPLRAAELARVVQRWTGQPSNTEPSDVARGGHSNVLEPTTLAALRELDHQDHEATAPLVGLFLSHTKSRLNTLRQVTSAGHWEEIALIAHSLRGSCSTFAAYTMVEMCSQLEHLEKNEIGIGGKILDALEVEFARVTADLSSIFNLD